MIYTIPGLFYHQVVFEAKVGVDSYGDIALDDIILEDGPCDTPSEYKKTSYVKIYNISDTFYT